MEGACSLLSDPWSRVFPASVPSTVAPFLDVAVRPAARVSGPLGALGAWLQGRRAAPA